MNGKVRKAVFPVAGLGTRFLPATKAVPKEMLPVVDKPLIQYGVEEAAAAGIEQLVFVMGRNEGAIADHFDRAYELEAELERAGKTALLEIARSTLPGGVECAYVRQAQALGLGHAVLCARHVIEGEPFAVLLPDDLIDGGDHGCLAQMVAVHERHGAAVVAVEDVPRAHTDRYGIVECEPLEAGVSRMSSIVEKPPPAEAPSTLGVVGRYILPGEIMDILATTGRGAGGEIQLTDAIATLIERDTVLAYEFQGRRYDCGSKAGFLEATVAYALQHPELGAKLRETVSDLRLAG